MMTDKRAYTKTMESIRAYALEVLALGGRNLEKSVVKDRPEELEKGIRNTIVGLQAALAEQRKILDREHNKMLDRVAKKVFDAEGEFISRVSPDFLGKTAWDAFVSKRVRDIKGDLNGITAAELHSLEQSSPAHATYELYLKLKKREIGLRKEDLDGFPD